ncbi:MAG: type III-A CRISPR-associated RAMP protein Csm3 [bacterium]|nr:type III-A CRISPR-associated RAMP protein Csm3 [bacterium]
METKNIPTKMISYKHLTGIIRVETGLHIGGSSDTIEIGGMDNPIITNPVTKEPYIPGSSLKGKMRSLLEWKLGKIETDPENFGEPYGYHEEDTDNHPISRIFGSTSDKAQLGPTRLVVRDSFVSENYKNQMRENNPNWAYTDLVEEKTENAINRITARANPRPIQRVVTRVEFDLEIIYRIFDHGDNGNVDKKFFDLVLQGLDLIEKDALGGSGSRGCGKVSFELSNSGVLKPLKEIKSENIPEIKLS